VHRRLLIGHRGCDGKVRVAAPITVENTTRYRGVACHEHLADGQALAIHAVLHLEKIASTAICLHELEGDSMWTVLIAGSRGAAR